ncbi:MAG: undecaprenyl-diphosphate phosphatase [Vicinamibacteraceae bacterium]
MDVLHAALLGVIQGITEFLPISSSAHLILARAFFGWDGELFGLPFDVATHLGTLAAVLAYFRADVMAMARAVPRIASAPMAFASASSTSWDAGDNAAVRLARLIVIGTLPIVVIGGLWSDTIEGSLRSPLVCALTLSGGALLFFVVERMSRQQRDEASLTAIDALLFGMAQSAALVPGVSRSGATIVMGMMLGLSRASAARFGFLLGIPAILAAAAKEGLVLARDPFQPGEATVFIIGIASSALVGYITVAYFMRFLGGHRLDAFAWYRLALAAAVAVWMTRL